MDNLSVYQHISKALRSFDEKQRKVLIYLYGLKGGKRHSLEEISNRLNASPGKILSVEKQALRRLRHPRLCKPLAQMLEKRETEIWSALSGSGSLVYKNQLSIQASEQLPGELLVAIKCIYGTLEGWLSENSCETANAWFRSKYPYKEVLKVLDKLEEMYDVASFPIPIGILAQTLQIDTQLLELAVNLLTNHFGIYKGYVARVPIAARTLRAVRFHLILSHYYSNDYVPMRQLIKDYKQIYSDDDLTFIDAEIAMHARPHLFLRLGELGWSGVGTEIVQGSCFDSGDGLALSDSDRDKKKYFFKRPRSGVPTIEIIRECLASRGACRISEINRYVMEKTNARLSPAGVGPILAQKGDFIRLAPGVYGLPDQYSHVDPVTATSDLLLRKKDCSLYIIARYAGEPLNSYPLWTPAMEWKWCSWAEELSIRKRYESKWFHSLLFIAEPRLWPSPDSEQVLWEFKKQAVGYYQFNEDLRQPIWRKIPTLRDVFTVAVCARCFRAMNWFKINRIFGQFLTDQNAAPVLALLIALDVIEPSDHWQKPHNIGPNVDDIVSMLSNDLHRKGSIQWNDEIGLALRNHLRAVSRREDLGWVDAGELEILIGTLDNAQVSRQIADGELLSEIECDPVLNDYEDTSTDQPQKQLKLPF